MTDAIFNTVLVTLPASLLVKDNMTVPVVLSFLLWLQPVFLHSPSRLHFGPLRLLFADNRYHRIHHSLEPAHFDRNFGVLLTIWDRLFGTAHFPGPEEWPDVGLAEVDQPATIREWLDLPLRYGAPPPPETSPIPGVTTPA